MISGKAKIAGVIGWPIAHSLSPVLHGYWLKDLGIDGALVPLAVAREDFSKAIDGMRRAGFRGGQRHRAAQGSRFFTVQSQ